MRDTVALSPAGSDRWRLSGALTFDTVPEAWKLLRPLLGRPGEVTLSLSGIKRVNSAALGLLLEGRELARRSGCRLVLRDVPAKLRDLAAMSNVESILLSGDA